MANMTDSRSKWLYLVVCLALCLVVAVFLAWREVPHLESLQEVTSKRFISSTLQPSTRLPERIPLSVDETESTRSIGSCSQTPSAFDSGWSEEQDEALKAQITRGLSISPEASHLHAASLITEDPAEQLALISRALEVGGDDPFLLWNAVQICSAHVEAIFCPLADWEERLLTVDSHNSETWLRIAANRYKTGNLEEALEAFRRASTAAETRDYWPENVEMIERGLAVVTGYTHVDRAMLAFTFADPWLPNYLEYSAMCEDQSGNSADWAYTCLAYNELVQQQGKTELGLTMAGAMAKLALKGLGESAKFEELDRRLKHQRRERADRNEAFYTSGKEILIFSQPTLFYRFLEAIRTEGETAARGAINDEVEALVALQPELLCVP